MLCRQVSAKLGALFLVAATACTPAAQPAASVPADPAKPAVEQKAVFAIGNMVNTLDQHAQIGQNGRRYDLFDCLVLPNQKGEPQPAIATSWKVNDPSTWQFTIRSDMKFHDGTPLTSVDVKYSYDRSLDPALKMASAARLLTIASVEAPNPTTVLVKTKAPDPILLRRLQAIAIVPKAYAERVGPQEFGVKPIGSGPFKLKEYKPNDSVTLTAFDEHPFRKPILREFTIRNVPEASARVAGLRTGDVDYINLVPLDQADRVKGDGFDLLVRNAGTSHGFFMDAVYNDGPIDSPTADKRVRQAINYAIDKDSIAKNIYRGLTKPASQVVQPETFGYNPNLKPYPYDPRKARELLAAAGYSNGFKLRIDTAVFVAEFQPMTLFIQQNLKDVGIEAEITNHADQGAWRDKFYNQPPRAPLFVAPLSNGPALDADFAINWFWSKNTTNRHMNNAEFDRLFEASQSEMDEAKRRDLLQRALGVIYEEATFLFVVDGAQVDAVAAKKLKGAEVWVEGDPRYDKIEKIS